MRQGQTLTLLEGGTLPANFAAVDATLEIRGGEVGRGLEAAGSQLAISDGTVGPFFSAYAGSDVSISGGTVGIFFGAYGNSKVTISGGRIADFFRAYTGSDVFISGGAITSVYAESDSQVYISGGEVDDVRALRGSNVSISEGLIGTVAAGPGAEVSIGGGTVEVLKGFGETAVNVYGTDFALDGIELNGPLLGEAVTIASRDVKLTGLFANGSPFSLDLNSEVQYGSHVGFFASDATLTVTLVSMLAGDYNSNGTVEQADLDLVLLNWGEVPFNPIAAGWINDVPSGAIDQEELDRVLLSWGDRVDGLGAAGVPEPAAAVMLIIAIACCLTTSRLRRSACHLIDEFQHLREN